jgi:hypothetical protein
LKAAAPAFGILLNATVVHHAAGDSLQDWKRARSREA